MRVLKVTLEGITTSFRYPHFMIGVQPTFPMPPPATIYGHICSTLGEWIDPSEISFAYHFTALAGFEDLEHTHILAASGGKLPGTDIPKIQEGSIQPFRRQLLYQPRLELYLNRPEWAAAFRSPVYPVVLGRSQDLCTYTNVEVIDLAEQESVYLEHTLLPYEMATQMSMGTVILMPRFLDYEQKRFPTFARYLVLQRRVPTNGKDFLHFGDDTQRFWSDPIAPQFNGIPRGLVFHSFQGDTYESLALSR